MAPRTPSATTSSRSARPGRGPQPAYVLHQHDWSESSLVLDLFTRDQGRITVVAKGAKRPYSQLRSVLLPFQRLLVTTGSLARTKGAEPPPDIQTLRGAEWAGGPAMLGGASLLTGFYLNELLIKGLARNDPHARLFDLYAATLPALSDADDSAPQSALRAFELVMLRELGVLPELHLVTLTQQPLSAAQRYTLHPEAGVALSPDDDRDGIPAATLKALQGALDAQDMPAVRQSARTALAPLRLQLRGLLHHLFGTDRLRTRQVMRDVQRLFAPSDS